jgi:hypothetical protein
LPSASTVGSVASVVVAGAAAGQRRHRLPLRIAASRQSARTASVPLVTGTLGWASTTRRSIRLGMWSTPHSGLMKSRPYTAAYAVPATAGPTGESRRLAISPSSRPAAARYAIGPTRWVVSYFL